MFTSISCSVRWGECAGAATVLWSVYRDESVLCLETISFPGRGCKSVPAVKGGGARVPRTKGGTVKFAKTCQTWWISCGSAPSQVLVRRLCRLPGPDSVCTVLSSSVYRTSWGDGLLEDTTTGARHNAVSLPTLHERFSWGSWDIQHWVHTEYQLQYKMRLLQLRVSRLTWVCKLFLQTSWLALTYDISSLEQIVKEFVRSSLVMILIMRPTLHLYHRQYASLQVELVELYNHQVYAVREQDLSSVVCNAQHRDPERMSLVESDWGCVVQHLDNECSCQTIQFRH